MVDREQKFSILVPDGKHIRPSIEKLLAEQGLETELWTNGRLHADVKNAPVTLTFQNHVDVIGEVEDGISQAGFVGSDIYDEYLASLRLGEVLKVGQLARFELFNPRVRLSLLVKNNDQYQNVEDLRGTRVVTTYPALVGQFLRGFFPDEAVLPIGIYGRVSGKEEGHVDDGRIFGAAGVIVDTGTAMRENNLRELATVKTNIQPVLVYNIEYFKDRGNRRRLDRFMAMIQNSKRGSSGDITPADLSGPQGFILGYPQVSVA